MIKYRSEQIKMERVGFAGLEIFPVRPCANGPNVGVRRVARQHVLLFSQSVCASCVEFNIRLCLGSLPIQYYTRSRNITSLTASVFFKQTLRHR